ncbi:MAG: MFS transporter [Acidimicrobiales bacterium]
MSMALERNLRLIPVHEILVRTSPWISVFVLFTRADFGLDRAVDLAGIYYLAVVPFEVPSGWLSDRVGRAFTLRLAALSWIGAFGCWLFADGSFAVVALGQVLLALGYASLSGTDVTFHYDTVEALGRADEFADRQALITGRGLIAGGLGAISGGLLGIVDFRLAFLASMLIAIAQLVVASMFVEPQQSSHTPLSMTSQVGTCFRYLRDVRVGWIFGYGIAMVVLEHVAFEIFQPWLTEALGETADDVGAAPLVSGAMIACFSVVGAVFARYSVVMSERFGLRRTLVALGALSAVIVTVMSQSTNILVIALVAFRSAQGAAAPILIAAAVAPVVSPAHRATFLSLDSLAGRLTWGTLLLIVPTGMDDAVSTTLGWFSVISWILVALTIAAALHVRRVSLAR